LDNTTSDDDKDDEMSETTRYKRPRQQVRETKEEKEKEKEKEDASSSDITTTTTTTIKTVPEKQPQTPKAQILLLIEECLSDEYSWCQNYLLETSLCLCDDDTFDESSWFRERRDKRLCGDVKRCLSERLELDEHHWNEFYRLGCYPVISGSTVMGVARNGTLFPESDIDVFVAQRRLKAIIDVSVCDFQTLTAHLESLQNNRIKHHKEVSKAILKTLGVSGPVSKTDCGYSFQHSDNYYDGKAWVYSSLSKNSRTKINIVFAEVLENEDVDRMQIHHWIENNFDTLITSASFDGERIRILTPRVELANYRSVYRFQSKMDTSNAERMNHCLSRILKYIKRNVTFPALTAVDGPLAALLHKCFLQGQIVITYDQRTRTTQKKKEHHPIAFECWQRLSPKIGV